MPRFALTVALACFAFMSSAAIAPLAAQYGGYGAVGCPNPGPAIVPFSGGSYSFHPPGYSSYYPSPTPVPSYSVPTYLSPARYNSRYSIPGPYFYTPTGAWTPGYYSYYYTPGFFRY
jgi:hypothetical protein